MNRHQVLTGAVNAGDNCYSVGSVEGVPFTAYTAGCNIVILANNFVRVQIIPGILHGNVQVACIDASTDVGKIAAAYGKKVCIFEPTPILDQMSVHKLDYKWIQTAALEADCYVTVISWNLEGTKLLTGGTTVQMWHLLCFPEEDAVVRDGKISDKTEIKIHTELDTDEESADKMRWDCVWQCRTASPVCFVRFSPDGTLFVSAGKSDRLVKIWYESAAKSTYYTHFVAHDVHKRSSHPLSDVNYTFVYIAHPRAVTGISWRKTSKYVPRGSVANMLVTSCKDNICRLWVQTLLPDDGLVNFSQIEGLENRTIPRVQTQRHRQKIMQRLKHMKSFSQFKKRHAAKEEAQYAEPIPNLPSTYSVHDFHSFGIHGTAMTPGFHFHLAASINAETDIPLVPSLISADGVSSETKNTPNFIIHWLNNKEMVFTQRAEKLLQQISMKIFQAESAISPHSDVESDTGECEFEGEEEYDVDSTITAESSKKFRHKLCRQLGKKCKKHGDPKEDTHHSRQSFHTLSSASTNVDSSNESASPSHTLYADILDQHLEALLRDWHTSSDLLFSIHPVDGSLLVWLIEWLDETSPGSFRQAQVSFSSRFPNAIPLGDAATMSHNVAMYSPYTFLDLRMVIANNSSSSLTSESKQKLDSQEKCLSIDSTLPTPTVYMITKHNNGSLNLWSIVFGEKTNFSQILSISHSNRVSGHRFRVNDIACHPVLPLLLTTSHHNLPGVSLNLPKSPDSSLSSSPTETPSNSSAPTQVQGLPNSGFCSELILWKVEPVGPLSESGGVTELARINSPETSAFANVAWIPTLLPSTTLGSISNSPSACFIASDGHQLRVYQAVIDARTLLAEVTAAQRKNRACDASFSASEDSTSSDLGMLKHHIGENFKIVSLQSTSRPGCILELDIIVDAVHDWKNTQLLQVFQDQLIRGDKEALRCWSAKQAKDSPGLVESSLGAVVDLRHSAVFEEPFYLIVIEKNERGNSVIHMWKLVISSQSGSDYSSDRYAYVPDSNLIQEDSDHSNQSSRTGTPDLNGRRRSHSLRHNPLGFASPLRITTSKVCTQTLPIPDEVEVIHASPAAGHLSSSNIYPACFAPYLLCTACSDGYVRFWRCKTSSEDHTSPNPSIESPSFCWLEWELDGLSNEKSSAIEVPGLPLYVSCAYSGRIACAYKQGQTYTKPTSKTPNRRYMNVNVAIFECESRGGSEWILEDTIHLRNITIPETELGMSIDIRPLIDTSLRNRKTADTLMMRLTNAEDHVDHLKGTNNIQRLLSVPSYTTMQSLKKIISEQGNQFTLTQKSIVQIDWVSTEDGSHVLTISVGSKISVFTPVSTDIAQANLQAMNSSAKIGPSSARRLLKQASSMAAPMCQPEDLRWMTLRTTQLGTADGLPPLPMQMTWVRDGILVVGMDNEMHIYTQWKSDHEPTADVESELLYPRTLTEQGLLTHAQESSHLRLPTHSALPRSPSASGMTPVAEAKKPTITHSKSQDQQDQQSQVMALSQLPDFGIFEASRLACPVLPQYHPKQLMELLAFGKIHRVRAILTHLVLSLCTIDSLKGYISQPQTFKYSESERSPRSWMRSRTLSIAAPVSPGVSTPFENENNLPLIPEEVQLDYTEITSVRPLPLFTLIEADFEKQKTSEKNSKKGDGKEDSDEYDSLFSTTSKSQVEETLDEILDRSVFNFSPKLKKQSEPSNLTDFNPRLARLLTKLLTHSHLPGLSSLDQMHLLALADAVASFNPSREKSSYSGDDGNENNQGGEPEALVSADSLDDCGLRFLLTMRQHTYLLRCLPLVQRKHLQKQGLGTCNLVWAFHSETQEELVKLIPGVLRGNPTWTELREVGVAWWLRNNFTLKRLIEQVAKASFQLKQDPLDAALFYLAMKKKSLVWGLYRSVGDRKMTEFFQHNFSDPKWRKAALKNAYALLGKQRFEHAAAFFLLAGNVWDAIEICLNKLDDLQLAMVVIRLYDGDIETVPQNLKRIFYEEILGCKSDGSNYNPSKAHPDAFLRSMSQWILLDYTQALTTLLEIDIGHNHHRHSNEEGDKTEFIHPSVFNFYLYLRTHPLVVRRQLAQTVQEKRGKELLCDTSWYGDASTPFERRLYFITAHQHFRAGCPSLALEVLSRLPNKIITGDQSLSKSIDIPEIITQQTPPIAKSIANGSIDKSDAFDWSTPSIPKESSLDFDWGAPVSSMEKVDTSDFKISISIDKCSDDEAEDDGGLEMKPQKSKSVEPLEPVEVPPEVGNKEIKLDIMAQQLKFIACLKILMEELSTLATGFEVDGGQLRYHLYVWLEKSVQALKSICSYRTFSMRNFGMGNSFDNETLKRHGSSMVLNDTDLHGEPSLRQSHSDFNGEMKPTLHEILLADKLDFEAKLHRSSRRKQWLQANEALLRTLLSYCSLHGSHGGGLASVRMELILLLQELQQERTQHQLLSPLPFPTTLPLLAASVACQKTVIADPIRHLHSVTHDILKTVTELNLPPLNLPPSYSLVHVLRDLGISLSACVYQSLCDSDNIYVKSSTSKTFDFLSSSVVCPNSHLLTGNQVKRDDASDPLNPTTLPNKWPGVQSLRALLARDKDEDSPKLHTLLCETYVAFYLSQLLFALAACDSHVVYRLIGQHFSKDNWSNLFGGGAKKLIHVAVAPKPQPQQPQQQSLESTQSSSIDLLNTLSKQRMKLHMKILQQLNQEKPNPTTQEIKEDRPTYRELFVPPQMSMLSYLMTKPQLPDELISLDYDSTESVQSEDDDEDIDRYDTAGIDGTGKVDDEIKYCDREQYAWGIMRCAAVKLARLHLIEFLTVAGIELQDLATTCPSIHAILKVMETWNLSMKNYMESLGGCPPHFLPNSYVESTRQPGGPAILKYKSILELNNSPFRSHNSVTKPIKRLWDYLVRQEPVQEIFIRYIFGKSKSALAEKREISEDFGSVKDESKNGSHETIRVVHKDQDNISSFCINKSIPGFLALATPKEIQELDVTVLLEPVQWLEEEAEYDILNLLKAPESLPATDYLVVQHPSDRLQCSPGGLAMQSTPPLATSQSNTAQTGRSTIMLKRHKTEGTRRMSSHPTLPLYISGSQDGSVTIWEWNHHQPILCPRPSGTFAKVTKVMFNQLGNKFGVTDGDGNLSLWQVALTASANKPFFSMQVHSKQASDFTFLGSSSLIVTAGHSADHKNVVLWDTLLPSKKSLVTTFACHEHHGASAVLYAPLNQLLITGGRRGDVFIFDMRQRTKRHNFQAHESAIKCMALDPGEDFFVTGSSDGDIKVWSLGTVHILLYSFPGEHSRSTLFRNIGMGVSHLYVDAAGRLYSCGADGSMKLRQLPDRHSNIICTI